MGCTQVAPRKIRDDVEGRLHALCVVYRASTRPDACDDMMANELPREPCPEYLKIDERYWKCMLCISSYFRNGMVDSVGGHIVRYIEQSDTHR